MAYGSVRQYVCGTCTCGGLRMYVCLCSALHGRGCAIIIEVGAVASLLNHLLKDQDGNRHAWSHLSATIRPNR